MEGISLSLWMKWTALGDFWAQEWYYFVFYSDRLCEELSIGAIQKQEQAYGFKFKERGRNIATKVVLSWAKEDTNPIQPWKQGKT